MVFLQISDRLLADAGRVTDLFADVRLWITRLDLFEQLTHIIDGHGRLIGNEDRGVLCARGDVLLFGDEMDMLAQRTHCLRFRVTLLSDIEDLVSLIQPFAHELLRAHHIGTAGVDTDQPLLLCLRSGLIADPVGGEDDHAAFHFIEQLHPVSLRILYGADAAQGERVLDVFIMHEHA